MKPFFNLILITILAFRISYAETLTQNIRGTVIDDESKITLPGANVVITSLPEIKGTTTDYDGNFVLENIPVGRHTVKISFLGYEEVVISDILVGSAKEIVLTVPLVETLTKLDEVVVTTKKGRPKNEMSVVSSRSFSVEETKRYPAGINDPSRMALNFAGVTVGDDRSNEIIIRGNTPNNMLWRIEGIEVPSPNHFSEEGSSSGFVSAISANLLDKSDFLTGAFPAEYGNGISGVFDIALRNGNNQTDEYSFQFGIMGTDLAAEGPFSKNYDGSYLVNYRYSTLDLLDKVGINLAGDVVPKYQDLSYKLYLPTKKFGRFSIWGLGGISEATEETDVSEMKVAATGITHLYFLDDKSYLKTVMAYSGNQSIDAGYFYDTTNVLMQDDEQDYRLSTLRGSILYKRKFSPKLSFKSGIILSHLMFNYYAKSIYYDYVDVDKKGSSQLYQFFLQTKYRLTNSFSLNVGMHSMYFALNDKYTIEPRAGISWKLMPKHSLGFGFGIHSRQEVLYTYFINIQQPDDTYTNPNRNLDLTKSIHYVLSYNAMITENLNFKTELYYQYLYDVPLRTYQPYTVSPINGLFDEDHLVSEGKARNYGIEFTLEKYFSSQYYFLITASLFESEIESLDSIFYESRYNTRFAYNIVGGKEFNIGTAKRNLIGVSGKAIWAGGPRTRPLVNGVPDNIQLFEEQLQDYFRIDFSIYYRINRPKVSHIISFDVQNIINRLNIYNREFNYDSSGNYLGYEDEEQNGILPIFNYRLEF